jgi:hypothetical protein
VERSTRSVKTGLGSRGGTTHLPGARAKYYREWRASNPEYREREKLRMSRKRNKEPTPITPLPPAIFCQCGCGCRNEVVTICGFCREGMHNGD